MLKTHFKSQKGIYFVLATVLMFVLFSMSALVLGTGFIILDNIKIQNLTNISAQAALEAYSLRYNPNINETIVAPNLNSRVEFAISMAKSSFLNNKLYSGSAEIANSIKLGRVESDRTKSEIEGSSIEFGEYLISSTDKFAATLCNNYFPCFLKRDPYTDYQKINTVRINIKTNKSDRLIAPFTKVVGFLEDGLFSVKTTATAVLIPKCTALAIDVSDLSFRDASLNSTAKDPLIEYGLTETITSVPQPFKRYLDATNGFLQKYSKTMNLQDKVVLYAYSDFNSKNTARGFVDRIPSYGTGEQSFQATNDIGFLMQVLNFDNAGIEDLSKKLRPSFLDRGWITKLDTPETRVKSNLLLNIKNVSEEMAQYCPLVAEKNIIIATHGITEDSFEEKTEEQIEIKHLNTFSALEDEISKNLLGDKKAIKSSVSAEPSSLLTKLKKLGIKLSFIHSSDKSLPNFCNRTHPNKEIKSLISFLDTILSGYTAKKNVDCSDSQALIDTTVVAPSELTDKCKDDLNNCVYKNITNLKHSLTNPTINGEFKYPNYYLTKMAIESGGTYCPLLKIASDSAYSHNTVPLEMRSFTPLVLETEDPIYKRSVNKKQIWKVEKLNDIEAGASCFSDIINATRTFLE